MSPTETKTLIAKVNGETVPDHIIDPTTKQPVYFRDMTVGEVARILADDNGIKAFTVFGDQCKLLEKDANRSMAEFSEFGIVTKDARG